MNASVRKRVRSYPRPRYFLFLVSLAAFLSEAIIMVVLDRLWPQHQRWEFIVDALLLVVLLAPLLYIWLYRPLVMQIEERKSAEAELEKTVKELTAALDNVQMLSGLLPICAWCKNIRNDQGYWQQLETYLSEHTEAEFSHGICPDCAKKIYAELEEEEAEKAAPGRNLRPGATCGKE